jgi:hypothetical protein
MKCIFCDNTAPKMPTIREFLGGDDIGEPRSETGICEYCQMLPPEQLREQSQLVVKKMIAEAVPKAQAIRESGRNRRPK